MRAFRFALDPVLDHRTRVEEERQQVVAARQRELDEARARWSELDEQYRRHARALRDGHERLTTDELRLHYAHLAYLDRRITEQLGAIARCRAGLDAARAELVAASQDRKVVERLKERRRAAYLAEELRAEQNETDDENARRHARGRAAGERS